MNAAVSMHFIITILTFLTLACKSTSPVDDLELNIPAHALETEKDLDAMISQNGDMKLHRVIGVVYNPAHERYGNYVLIKRLRSTRYI